MRPHVVAVTLVFLSGCFSLKPGTDVADMSVGTDDLQGGNDAAGVDLVPNCWDPSGFGGKGCYSCTPTNREQLLNACSSATCLPYDNTAIGTLPTLPNPDFATVPSPADMGSATDLSDADLAPPPDLAPVLPACASLTGGKVVYAAGSSAVTLFLGNIAQALENAASPLTIVYQSQGSCVGISAVVTPSTTKMTGTAIYWDPNTAVDPSSAAAQLKCQLEPGGVNADIGLSDVFAGTCLSLPGGLDASIKDFFGPVQVMNFVVPQNSSAQNISAEAAFLVYGFGALAHVIAPWSDLAQIFQRNGSSGTQAMLAATIGVPKDSWYGKSFSGSGAIRDALVAAGGMGQGVASKTIGILSSDVADAVRTNLRILAFQDYNQRCGFYPDSSVTSKDKVNVRDGHYPNFGPLHMLTHVNTNGIPTSAEASTVLNAITGVAAPDGVDIIDLYAKRSMIPLCAMKVTRDADGGEIKPFAPSQSCSCYYTERATGLVPPPNCTVCDRSSDCPASAPNCNKFASQTKGYCER